MTEVASSLGNSQLPLVWSKLQVPTPRPSITRRQLLDRLTGPCRLVLVRAPAGWGKSTLLAQWSALEEETRPFAWLSLDEQDNDPVQFWTYVIEALHLVAPTLGKSSRVLAQAPGVNHAEVTVPVLLNELATAGQPLVLVLDDFHLLSHPDIPDGLARLLRHLPPGVTVAVATRSDPGLPLSRLRAGGELVEIDTQALSFTVDEADEFFTTLHGFALDSAATARLCGRAEGWAAGLYLAALSLRGREEPRTFIEAFAGDDRSVVDYLSEEVLSATEPATLAFLRRTSILTRLSAPLCDAVTEGSGSAQSLEDMARSNAFVIPLDTRMEWYRYHHLFKDLLRRELERVEPGSIPSLHRRAATWLLDAGSASEAIHHTIAAGDPTAASRLIVEHWQSFRDENRQETILGWLDALGTREAQSPDDGTLSLIRAASLIELGRLTPDVENLLDVAEHTGSDAVGPVSVSAAVSANRAILLYQRGDVRRILATVPGRLEGPTAIDPYWRCVLLTVLGAAQFLALRSEDAAATLADAVATSTDADHALAQTHSLGWIAAVHADTGEHNEALAVLDRVERLHSTHPELREYYGTSLAHVVRAWMLERDGNPGSAQASMARAVELASRGSSNLQLGYAMLAQVQLSELLGEHDRAAELLAPTRNLLATCPDPGSMDSKAERLADRLLRTGKRSGAGIASLTDRELQVARLVTARKTNPEIAAELFVSLKTVETHVRHIFSKLDVGSRVDVARAVEEADRATRRDIASPG